jgi:hypothetical protein
MEYLLTIVLFIIYISLYNIYLNYHLNIHDLHNGILLILDNNNVNDIVILFNRNIVI